MIVSRVVEETEQCTHGAAPNALLCVSLLIAENVFVMTATKRLMSQKLSTMMHTMKKKQDTKNSESIMLYIKVDHWNIVSRRLSVYTEKHLLHWQRRR